MLPIEIESRKAEIRSQIEALGAELVDMRFYRGHGRSVITILADKPDGITLEDCARINRHLGSTFEFMEGAYFLEVNSPGLDRPLVTERDYLRTIGKKIRVIYQDELGKTQAAAGTLTSMQDEKIEMELKGGIVKQLGLKQIMKTVREITFS